MTQDNTLFNNRIWFTTKEAATYLRVTENALRIIASREKIPRYKLGKRSVRYKIEDLNRLLTPVRRRIKNVY
ncbi:helix-turn-helix domain-containing protein [Halobacteriovorax sp. GFR7]|uniref:helix-turn-helix domain-containing protein n=1 Tax=unclassified Halobacteriovorax TaxID=2639665 RepID=UPI003D95356B